MLLKYIGRPLQLLTSVHERPLLSERYKPGRARLSAGTRSVSDGGVAPNPRPRPPLLHQSNPPRPAPATTAAESPPSVSICAYTTLVFERATSTAMRPYVPGGSPLPVSLVHVRPASSVFHSALPGPPPLKQQPVRRRW